MDSGSNLGEDSDMSEAHVQVTLAGDTFADGTTGRDERIADPSTDDLVAMVEEVAERLRLFVVVGRPSDGEQTFIQVAHEDDGLVVEHREGTAERHFQARTGDAALATRVVVDWASQGSDWRTLLPWQRIQVIDPPAVPKKRWFSRER